MASLPASAGRVVVLAIGLCLAPCPSRAADEEPLKYRLVSWTEQDGLPGSQIGAIAQDGDGYLWLATNAGLVRFDGVRFVDWPTIRPAGPSLPAASLHTGRDGGLWIGLGGGGVAHLNQSRVTVHAPGERGLPHGTVRSLVEDRHGALWAVGQFGVARWDDQRWTHLGPESGLPREAAYAVHEDRRGGVWVGTDVGVFHQAAGEDVFAHVQPHVRAWAFTEDPHDRIWITGLNDPLRRLEDRASPLVPNTLLALASGGWRLHADSRGNIWVATLGGGAWRAYDLDHPDGPRIERFNGGRLSNEVARSVLEDREGNIWVGTDNGLNRLTPSPLPLLPPAFEAVSQPVVAVARDRQGAVWAGTQNGLYRFDHRGLVKFDRADGLPGVSIYSLHVDAGGTLWAAGDHFGLARLEGRRFVAVPLPQTPSLRIVALASDRSGAIYLADVDRGAFRWKDGRLAELLPDAARRGALAALTDRHGRVWMGLAGGVLRADPEGQVHVFDQGIGRVLTLYEDSRGTIWAGGGFGLASFDGDRFTTVRFDDATTRRGITAIVEDEASNLWLGLRAGVFRLSRDDLDHARRDPSHPIAGTVYDMADGLHGIPIWLGFPTAARSGDGTLWFVTANGLAPVDPLRARKHRLAPPVRIESVTTDGEEREALSGLRLGPGMSNLQIDYTGLSFTVPSKVRFRYRLEGFDREWVDAGTRRQAFYTNLAPGNYRFGVAAQNDGVWNDGGASWDFSIAPMFYQRAWFRLLLLTLGALGVWAMWQQRVRRVREQFDLVLAERARMGREIHDTLLQSLVGVTLQFNTLAPRLEGPAVVLRGDFERLRRQLEACIREARQSILDLRSALAKTQDLGSAIRQIAEKQTRGTGVSFDLVVSGGPRTCAPRIQQPLLRIAQEATANAIRHADARHIHLELAFADAAIVLRVADDGRGFDPQQAVFTPADHWGLGNMQERAEQIGGQLRLTSSPGAGTEIEAVIPLSSA